MSSGVASASTAVAFIRRINASVAGRWGISEPSSIGLYSGNDGTPSNAIISEADISKFEYIGKTDQSIGLPRPCLCSACCFIDFVRCV